MSGIYFFSLRFFVLSMGYLFRKFKKILVLFGVRPQLRPIAQQAPSSNLLGVQMKTTTFKQVKKDTEHFRFYLKKKNFNDLIAFKNDWYSSDVFGFPLLLLVHVLPDEEADWIKIDVKQQSYKINGLFYWYFPEEKTDFSEHPSKQPIFIKNENLVSLDFFNKTFNLFFKYTS